MSWNKVIAFRYFSETTNVILKIDNFRVLMKLRIYINKDNNSAVIERYHF